MSSILVLIIVVAIIAALVPLLKAKSGKTGTFRARKFLLTKTEMSFYNALLLYLPKDRHVMAKVGLKEIIETISSDKQQRSGDWGRIKSKHIDFVLIDSSTSQIISCIELDDSSHNTEAAKRGDGIKNDSLKSAGVRLIRIRASASYSKEQLIDVFK